jgi:hypothetical protein
LQVAPPHSISSPKNRFSDVNATISEEKSKEKRWAIPIFAENEKRWMLYEND